MTIHSVVIQKLLSTNAHMGRRVAAHHFKIYSCGTRNAMTIIDSDKTLICLRSACNFIGELVRSKARFLFVNTNFLFDEIILQMTKRIGCKYDNSWRLGGFLTNNSSPKKFRGRNKKLNLGALQAPDCVVIFDTERKSSVIAEAHKLQIPIVGLVDSSMPWETYKKITYPVPANDSVEFVYLFCNLITKTFLYEQKRLGSALTSVSTSKPEAREDIEKIDKDKVIGKDQILVLPYESLVTASEDVSQIKQLLDKLAVLKINGQIGTDMGFKGPRSTIEVCNGLTCLDLIVNQIESLNSKYGCNIPLLLANSINTHEEILKALLRHPNKNIHAFVQSQHQLEDFDEFAPTSSGQENEENDEEKDPMYPEDLAEVVLSLKSSGKLNVLLSQGKEYLLVVHSDNVAHIVDPKILNHLIQDRVDHCVEVIPSVDVEEGDQPFAEGNIQLKKSVKSIDAMWLSMTSVESLVEGAALYDGFSLAKLLDQPLAISVPRSRHLPVERTSDLLLLQSDLFSMDNGTLVRNTARQTPANPSIELGPEFQNVGNFHERFKSIPSILELDSLKVVGDVWFGSGIVLKGKVIIMAKPGSRIHVPDGVVLQNKFISSQGEF